MGELLSLAGVSNPPKRSFPLPLWSLGCLAMLLLLCVVGTGFAVISFVQSAQRFNQDRVNVTAVLDQFMQAGQQQNAHTGYNLFAVGTPQTSVTMTYLEDLFANHREFFAGYKMVQPGTLQTSSDLGSSSVNAFMAGDVVYVNHANVPYTAYFLQANGQWKLLRVQFGQVVGALLTATAVATVAPSKTPFLGDSTVTALAALSLVTPEDYFNRGRQYAGKGDYQDALTDYDVALHLQPDYADALYNRGYIYALQNDTDKALDDFSNAIRLQPTNEVFL